MIFALQNVREGVCGVSDACPPNVARPEASRRTHTDPLTLNFCQAAGLVMGTYMSRVCYREHDRLSDILVATLDKT
jgi:hypothetical protein